MNTFRTFMLVAFTLTTTLSFSQVRRVAPVPSEGYWVVETSPRPNRQSVAYFYNNDHVLIYHEQLKRPRINIRRERVAERLNAVLVQAARQYAATRQMLSNQNWVAAEFK